MKKLSLKKSDKKESVKSKIVTQKNLEQSREEVLAKGKKFKYPFQYAKHRMVINAILIGLVALIVFAVFGWWQLYKVQNTSSVAYRFTKVLNLPVADIDGTTVRYSDYLMIYRSSISSLEYQRGALENSDDDNALRQHYKRAAMNAAEEYSYALAELEKNNITVESSEVDDLVNYHMQINGQTRSAEAFEGIVNDNFGLSMTEYRRMLTLSLAKKKYSENYDNKAKDAAKKVEQALKNSNDLSAIADSLADSGVISYSKTDKPVSDTNIDGGQALMAKGLANKGDVSNMFVSKNGDAYCFVKLLEKTEDGKVSYEAIQVRFTELQSKVQEIRDRDGGVNEYIDLNDSEGANSESEPDFGAAQQ